MELKIQKSTLKISIVLLLIITAAFVAYEYTPLSSLVSSQSLQRGSLIAVFLTGLITGGLTCLAVQGGLLAATIAQREQQRLEDKVSSGHALPIMSFLIAKLIAYTILGLLLGWLGSVVSLTLNAQLVMQVIVVVFMLGTALNILEAHPIFRYFAIQPPRFLTRFIRSQSKSSDVFAPGVLGALTVFIPCGTTQAMMALAIASASPVTGALILFAFVLGTSPLFFSLGYFATRLGEAMQRKFMRFAAFALIVLALFNLNGAIALTGSSFTLSGLFSNSERNSQNKLPGNPVSEATIEFYPYSYSPNTITVATSSKVKLNLKNSLGRGCIQAFTIPKLGIQKIVPIGTSQSIEFTTPKNPTRLVFTCSMGMYSGVINVINVI